MNTIQTKTKAKAKSLQRSPKPTSDSSAWGTHGVSHSSTARLGAFYSSGPVFGLGAPVQTKLTIGHPNDSYEREADAVADRVAAGQQAPPISRIPSGGLSNIAQRQMEEEEKPEESPVPAQLLQRQEMREEEEEGPIQTKVVQRQEEEEEELPVQGRLVQRQATGEEETSEESPIQPMLIQRQATDEEPEEEPVQPQWLQRQTMEEEEPGQPPGQPKVIQQQAAEEEEEVQAKSLVQRQAAEEEDELAQTKPMGNRLVTGRAMPIQPKSDRAQTLHVSSAIAANIHALEGSGRPLPQAMRAFFEPRFGADFSQVRVHADSQAADTTNAIQAKAFTVGQNIAFGTGQYAPHSHEGRRLLTHELTHVVQQRYAPPKRVDNVAQASSDVPFVRATAARAIHRDAMGATTSSYIQRAPAPRVPLETAWYIEMTPNTSVIPVGTRVRFTLKNPYFRPNMWKTRSGTPVFSVRGTGGKSMEKPSNLTNEPYALKTFAQIGHYKVYFRGAPRRPDYLGYYRPVHVSVELDVVKYLTTETMQAPEQRGTLRQDISRAERATGPAFVQAFKRIAVRRAIDIVNRNKMEALKLVSKYTPHGGNQAALRATRELQKVARLDQALAHQIDLLKYKWVRVEHPTAAEPWASYTIKKPRQKVDWTIVKNLELARASLVNAFPAVALGRKSLLTVYATPTHAQKLLVAGLQGVMTDCDTTRRALATGKLDIFEAPGVVAEVRRVMSLSACKQQTLNRAMREHRVSGVLKGVGSAGVSLLLLLIPGLGPYLSAAVGLASAAVSWKHAQTLEAAAGAGVRKGIVTSEAAATAKFWGMFELLLAGLEVAQLAKAFKLAKGIKPHVPAAAERTIPAATRVTPEIPTEVTQVWKPVAREIPRDYLINVLEQTFGAKVDWEKVLKLETNPVKFGEAWRAAKGRGNVPLAFFDPNTGFIYIGPKVTNLKVVFHEALHATSSAKNPLLRGQIGEFLSEGMTERLAQRFLGRSPKEMRKGLAYPENVAFVALLEQKVGRQVIERAFLGGDYGALRRAVKQALGGSRSKTRRFFDLARDLERTPRGMLQQNKLRRLLNLLTKGSE